MAAKRERDKKGRYMPADLSNEDGSLNTEAAEQALDAFEAANPPEAEPEKTAAKDPSAAAGAKDDKTLSSAKDPSDDDSDDDDAAADDAKDDDTAAGGDDGGEDWMATDDVKALLASMNLSEEQAREFTGPDELDRHAKLMDLMLVEDGKAALAAKKNLKPGEEEAAAREAQRAAQERLDAEKRAAEQESQREGTGFKSKLDREDPEGVHEDLIDEIERVANFYEQRIGQLEARLDTQLREFTEREARTSFDAIVNSLGQEALLGSSESPKREARDKLREAVDLLSAGLQAKGRPAELTPALVKRALNLEFADEIHKQHRDSFASTVRKQSQRKLGGGGRRAVASIDQPWTGDPAKDPVLHAAYAAMEKENGDR